MVRNRRIELLCPDWQSGRLPLTSIPLWWGTRGFAPRPFGLEPTVPNSAGVVTPYHPLVGETGLEPTPTAFQTQGTTIMLLAHGGLDRNRTCSHRLIRAVHSHYATSPMVAGTGIEPVSLGHEPSGVFRSHQPAIGEELRTCTYTNRSCQFVSTPSYTP